MPRIRSHNSHRNDQASTVGDTASPMPTGGCRRDTKGKKASFEKHLAAQEMNRDAYAAKVILLIKHNADMSQSKFI